MKKQVKIKTEKLSKVVLSGFSDKQLRDAERVLSNCKDTAGSAMLLALHVQLQRHLTPPGSHVLPQPSATQLLTKAGMTVADDGPSNIPSRPRHERWALFLVRTIPEEDRDDFDDDPDEFDIFEGYTDLSGEIVVYVTKDPVNGVKTYYLVTATSSMPVRVSELEARARSWHKVSLTGKLPKGQPVIRSVQNALQG